MWNKTKIAFAFSIMVAVLISVSWGAKQTAAIDRQWKNRLKHPDKIELLIVQAETEFASSNRRMIKATQQAANQADLIVWPESALGNYDRKLTSFADSTKVKQHSKGKGSQFRPWPNPVAPLLAGANTWTVGDRDNKSKHFVSALLIDQQEDLIGRHDKIELMPYGEYIPGETFLPQLRKWFGGQKIITRGKDIKPIGKIGRWEIGTVLCCEDMYPAFCQSLTEQNSDVLISIGNGMAFFSDAPLRQHFRIARLRAIENRRTFVRCMNRGISAVVSPSGKVVNDLPTLNEGAMLISIPPTTSRITTFTKYGTLPACSIIAFIFAMGLIETVRKKLSSEA